MALSYDTDEESEPTAATDERAEWIETAADTILDPLAIHGYSREDRVTLAGVMFDLDITPKSANEGTMTARQSLRYTALSLDERVPLMATLALAQALRLPDYNRLMLPSRTAASMLGVARARLGGYRDQGRLTPALDDRHPLGMGGQQLWWIDDILLALADDRQRGGDAGHGRGKRRFPTMGPTGG